MGVINKHIVHLNKPELQFIPVPGLDPKTK